MQTKQSKTSVPGALNHPDTNQWVEFLYGEVTSHERSQLEMHLANCRTCRAQVDDWRITMRKLDGCSAPSASRRAEASRPFAWAAAAAVILAAGFAFGRINTVSAHRFEDLRQA